MDSFQCILSYMRPLVVPNVFCLRIMEAAVLLETFNAAVTQSCLCRYFLQSHGSCETLCMYVPLQIMPHQSNLPQLISIQAVETSLCHHGGIEWRWMRRKMNWNDFSMRLQQQQHVKNVKESDYFLKALYIPIWALFLACCTWVCASSADNRSRSMEVELGFTALTARPCFTEQLR